MANGTRTATRRVVHGARAAAATGVMCALAATGCSAPDEPYWAFDPVWIEPAGADGVYGFQTWELFSKRWSRGYKDKFYVCSIVVELDGEARAPDATCPGCTRAWEVFPAVLESDCDPSLAAESGYLALRGLALGPVDDAIREDDPFPGQSQGGFADYGAGWETHGWAYPEALDHDGVPQSASWDGDQAFTLWPAYAWELSP
jgi:hypothetical protein